MSRKSWTIITCVPLHQKHMQSPVPNVEVMRLCFEQHLLSEKARNAGKGVLGEGQGRQECPFNRKICFFNNVRFDFIKAMNLTLKLNDHCNLYWS